MAQLRDLLVTSTSRFLGKVYATQIIGNLTGNAETATKLTTSAGSATQPVYFSDGKPVACTYTLGKSVPSDAVFTDTKYTHPSHTAKSSGLYKITVDNLGHVSGATSVTKEDITALGIPGSSINTHYTTHLYAGVQGGNANITTETINPYLLICDDTTNRNSIQLKAGTNMKITTKDGVITFTSNYTNTWRGIQNNLTSDSTTDSLSAAQGKVLKGLVDGKAASSHTHSQYLTSHQDISQVMKNRGVITNTTDFNTLVDSGCYKVQMSSWGAANTYHSPNEFKSDLYSFGLMLVIRSDTADAEKRITQIYFPHNNSDDNHNPVLMRMHNGTDINSGWHAWHRFSNNTDTWRGIQNNLTSDSTTDSLSAAQGKLLANGSARDNSKLPLTGGTLTGSLDIRGTAASQPLKTRGIVGSDGNGTVGELYLQYGASKEIYLGNSGSYNISADGGSYSGNSATATKLATARTIALTGSVTGSGTFDGSGNLSIATTTNHTHTKSDVGLGNVDNVKQMPISSWNWAPGSGQPSWIWGGNEMDKYYVYRPSELEVGSAGKSNSIYLHPSDSGSVTDFNSFEDGLYKLDRRLSMSNSPVGTDTVHGYLYQSSNISANMKMVSQIFIRADKNHEMYTRSCWYDSWQSWSTILNNNNYSSYSLPLSGGTLTGDVSLPITKSSVEESLPVSSGNMSITDITSLSNYKTYLGSYLHSGAWYNLISTRHRNGAEDGTGYGMYLRSPLVYESNLTWGKQTGSSSWQAERTILDSANYSSYALPLSGGTMTGDIKRNGNAVVNTGTNGSTNFSGGTNLNNGAALILRGSTQTGMEGRFELWTTGGYDLIGRPSGELSWNGIYINLNSSSYYTHIYSGSSDYPHLVLHQYSNGYRIYPNQTKMADIGESGSRFMSGYFNNVYNSSGAITTSDKNKKHDIEEITDEFSKKIVDGLIPSSFKFNDGSSGRTHFGIIAQDLEKLLETLGISTTDFAPLVKDYPNKEVEIENPDYDENDENSQKYIKKLEKDYDAEPIYNVRYEEFIMILVKYCQCLKKKDLDLEKRLSELEEKVNKLIDG